MKAMIAVIALMLSSQAVASSFDDFANTNTGTVSAQNIIVKFKGDTNYRRLGFQQAVMSQSPIIPNMNIHLLQPNPMFSTQNLLKELRNNPYVEYAQMDHQVTQRELIEEDVNNGPNDSEFGDQWSMGLSSTNFGIDALSAWTTYGTGGKDVNNNDIVVAVVDGGVEITHSDLVDNIWVNEQEIAGNNIDDDGNGYIDDMNGWNGYTNSGKQQSNSHGTHVSGIVGARGNNSAGVAGVNWNVKIMNVPGSSGNTSVVLTAYKYVLEQKKLWLATNGAKGANIVSTNSSFGIDFADCNSGDYPAWNDIYTEMGKVGILSAAATANRSVNIDQVGDVPTGCDSPYIVTVTNTQSNGSRSSAGYGITTIDLAAPGTNIHSTYTGNSYRKLTGTSMATPHVAGAVAFLASIASKPLADLYLQDPGAAALEVKRMMMETVTTTSQLQNESVAGGILNLNAAAKAVTEFGMGN